MLGLCLGALAACAAPAARQADILLFVGTGTSRGDVAAVEQLLRDGRFSYTTADSPQLNAMSREQIRAYRLVIVPGGNFEQIGNGLTPVTTANLRGAVRGGTNYLGLCAGAFLAGNSPYNGLDLFGGVRFPFYALEAQGIRKSAVRISVAGGVISDQYWEDGPQLSGWGQVVGRYPDSTAAIVQGRAGTGWVILTGTHPEAPESWRRGLVFATPARETIAFATSLIAAALNGTALEHY